MQKRSYRQWPPGNSERLILVVVLSLFLHLFIFGAIDKFYKAPDTRHRTTPMKVSMRTMSKSEWKKNLTPKKTVAKSPKKEEKPRPEKKEPDKKADPKGQIVDLSPPKNEKSPEHSRFLSEYDSTVDKQTRSKYQKTTYERHAAKPRLVGVKKQKQAEKGQDKRKKAEALVLRDAAPSKSPAEKQQPDVKQTDLKLEIPKRHAQSMLKLEEGGDRDTFLNQEHKSPMNGKGERLNVNLHKPTQQPPGSPSEAQAAITPEEAVIIAVAGGPMADHLENIDQSDETALNSRSFKYATYFNRVKREVARNWHPQRVHRKYDPNFNIYGFQDRRTVLYITVRSDGSLERAEVQEPSGVDFLDEEAIAAFYRGSPFPNPPQGLLGKNGKFGFSFGFYFEISSVKFQPLFGPP